MCMNATQPLWCPEKEESECSYGLCSLDLKGMKAPANDVSIDDAFILARAIITL